MGREGNEGQWPLSAFGARLEAARRVKRLSKPAAARAADVHVNTWTSAETGFRYVAHAGKAPASLSIDAVARMAKAVGLDPREMVELAGMDPEKIPAQLLTTQLHNDDGTVEAITDAVHELGPDQRKLALDLIRALGQHRETGL